MGHIILKKTGSACYHSAQNHSVLMPPKPVSIQLPAGLRNTIIMVIAQSVRTGANTVCSDREDGAEENTWN